MEAEQPKPAGGLNLFDKIVSKVTQVAGDVNFYREHYKLPIRDAEVFEKPVVQETARRILGSANHCRAYTTQLLGKLQDWRKSIDAPVPTEPNPRFDAQAEAAEIKRLTAKRKS